MTENKRFTAHDENLCNQILAGDLEGAYFRALLGSNIENVGLVKTIALKFQGHMDLTDLCQFGFIGLMKGLEDYRSELGPKSNYLGIKIQKEISRAVENYSRTIRIPSGQWEAIRKLKKHQGKQAQKEGSWSKLARIAKKTKLGKAGTAALGSLCQNHTSTFFNYSQSDHQASVEFQAETKISLERLSQALIELNYQEERVLTLYYGLNGTKREFTLKEIGQELGFSRETARTIRNRALKKLKTALE